MSTHRRKNIQAHVEMLLRSTGVANVADLGLHKNTLRKEMAKRLNRDVRLRGSVLMCEPDAKRPGGSSPTIGGEDHIA